MVIWNSNGTGGVAVLITVPGRNERGFTNAGLLPRALQLEHSKVTSKSAEGDFSTNSLLIILHRMSNLETSMRLKFLGPSSQGQDSRT